MVVSNSGRMRKLKDKIRIALNAELLLLLDLHWMI